MGNVDSTASAAGPTRDQGSVPSRAAEHATPRCLAVMYHYVHDREPLKKGVVGGLSEVEFKHQLDLLCRELEPIDWPMLYASLQNRGSIPRRSFLLTFDDGLADHAGNVVPILEERGLRGVFFVPGAVLASHRMLAAHAIHVLLATLGEERLLRELEAYRSERPDAAGIADRLDTAAAEEMYHYEPPARAHLKYLLTMALPIELRDAAVMALFERYVGSPERWARHWYLGWDDLVAMQAHGHTIGGHGYIHEPYERLTPARCHRDLRRVASILDEGLGSDIRPFSYPYGSYSGDSAGACRAWGFAHAFTTRRGWITLDSNLLRLPRVDTIDVDAVLQEEPVHSLTTT